jgi:hypothetical protein
MEIHNEPPIIRADEFIKNLDIKPNNINNINIADEQIRGLGDDIETAIKSFGMHHIAKLYTKVTGLECKCSQRKEWLNKLPSVWTQIKRLL